MCIGGKSFERTVNVCLCVCVWGLSSQKDVRTYGQLQSHDITLVSNQISLIIEITWYFVLFVCSMHM